MKRKLKKEKLTNAEKARIEKLCITVAYGAVAALLARKLQDDCIKMLKEVDSKYGKRQPGKTKPGTARTGKADRQPAAENSRESAQ